MRNIAPLRKARGWTQVDLAHEAGVTQTSISKAERGAGGVSVKLLQEIADALDVPIYQLFLTDRDHAEIALLAKFRQLHPERQKGWIDMMDEILKNQ